MPIARAMRSICISVANDASVTPKPRKALDGWRFVYTQCTSIDTLGIVYGPAALAACLVRAVRASGASRRRRRAATSTSRETIRPSFITPSTILMRLPERVEDTRISSSRVKT